MADSLTDVTWEGCLLEPRRDRALEAFARRTRGMPTPAIRYFASVPWLARALVALHPAHGPPPLAAADRPAPGGAAPAPPLPRLRAGAPPCAPPAAPRARPPGAPPSRGRRSR